VCQCLATNEDGFAAEVISVITCKYSGVSGFLLDDPMHCSLAEANHVNIVGLDMMEDFLCIMMEFWC